MDINITFIIQGINFWISYLVLKNVFLKPAVSYLEERDREYDRLNKTIAESEQIVEQKERDKNQRLTNFKREVCQARPMATTTSSQPVPAINYKQDEAANKQLHQTVVTMLTENIDHAH